MQSCEKTSYEDTRDFNLNLRPMHVSVLFFHFRLNSFMWRYLNLQKTLGIFVLVRRESSAQVERGGGDKKLGIQSVLQLSRATPSLAHCSVLLCFELCPSLALNWCADVWVLLWLYDVSIRSYIFYAYVNYLNDIVVVYFWRCLFDYCCFDVERREIILLP